MGNRCPRRSSFPRGGAQAMGESAATDAEPSSGHAPLRHSGASSFRRKPESRGRAGGGLVIGPCPPSSFRRKPESRCRTGRGTLIGPCPSIVIPAEAGIQVSPWTGIVIGPCPSIVIPAKAGIQRSPRTRARRRAMPPIVIPAKAGIQRSHRTGDSHRAVPLHRHSGGSRNPEVTPDRGLSSDRTPCPIPSSDGGRIGRATDTTPGGREPPQRIRLRPAKLLR